MQPMIKFLIGLAIWIPTINVWAAPSASIPSLDGLSSFVYPIMAPRLSSTFGNRRHPIRKVVRHHDGVDLAAPMGAPIRVIAKGFVVFADTYGSYGKLIVIRHQDGITSHYGHCSEISVTTGQQVSAGQIIGRVGETGGATGPHLHFEIRSNGKPFDPKRLIPNLTSRAAG